MYTTTECKYYSPCGLCIKYDKPCEDIMKEFLQKKNKKIVEKCRKNSNIIDGTPVTWSKELK